MKRIINCFFFVLFFVFQSLSAQDLNRIATLDVDQLSDEKVKRFWMSAQKQGYNLQQTEVILKAKGMSQVQVDKLKERIRDIENKPVTFNQKTEVVNSDESGAFGLIKNEDTKSSNDDKPKEKLYGYEFFNNPKISFTPNINVATPQNYRLGPGDVVQIDVWGAAEATYQKKIDKQGHINIENVGQVNLSGLTFEDSETKIKSYLRRIYAGINASRNSYNKVYVGVSLAKVRTVQVNLVGEVKTPGTYSLSALSNVLNALYAAGGPTKEGNFRTISLVRNGQRIADFDFYKYLQEGSEKGNLTLQDQDVIIVSPYSSLVTVNGAVKRSGFYQMKKGESMKELFQFCGGFLANAYRNSIVIERIKGNRREILEFDFNNASNQIVKNGDVVSVKEIADKFENGVSISGAVYIPGSYEFNPGMTVQQLIEKASGLKKDAFMKRAMITRYENEVDKVAVSFSLDESSSVKLQSNDEVRIYAKDDLRKKRNLTIRGAVNNPKDVEFAEGLSVEDLIVMAGGLKLGADPDNIEVSRRNKEGGFEVLSKVFKLSSAADLTSNKQKAFVLKPYDIISVRYLKGYEGRKNVTISGEVKVPGDYTMTTKNERISDLLERAGGLSPYANIEGAMLIRKKVDEGEKKQDSFLKHLEDDKVTFDLKRGHTIGINLVSILNNKGREEDLILEENDELFIPTLKQTIEVRGQVFHPSIIQYVPGKSLGYYVDKAGGFTPKAKKNRAYVVYSNGTTDGTDRFLFVKNYPKIKPGSIILVPAKLERTGKGVSAQEIIGITSGLATLGILVDRLLDKN